MGNFETIPPKNKEPVEIEQLPENDTITEVHQILDMKPFLQRVPPIEGIFSPDKEMQKLWLVPKEERRKAVLIFKDKLARQREAWALCRTSIEERIEANPDLPMMEMIEVIREFASHYGFAEPHTKIAEQLVGDYIAAHKRVAEVREKYPDDIALINRLTGLKFTKADAEDFSILVGPMSIDILCSKGRNNEDIEDSMGFMSQSNDKQPIYYVVINKKKLCYKDDELNVRLHEHEHVKNRALIMPRLYPKGKIRDDVRQKLNQGVFGFFRHQIYEKILRFGRIFEDELLKRYSLSTTPQQKAFFLKEYMRLSVESALNRVKDEMIAIFKGGSKSFGKFDITNMFLPSQGHYSTHYDYLASIRDFIERKENNSFQKISQKVLVDKYRITIERAIASFNKLADYGYTLDESIALLSDKSLSDWTKIVKRLSEKTK